MDPQLLDFNLDTTVFKYYFETAIKIDIHVKYSC